MGNDPNTLWRQLISSVLDFLHRILAPLKHLPAWVLWTIVIWMVLTLLLILAHLIVCALEDRRRMSLQTAGGGRSPRAYPGEILGIRDLDFDAVYAEAGRLVGAGEWPAATRYLYVAAILWLRPPGPPHVSRVEDQSGLYPGIAARGPASGSLSPADGPFEPIVYGGQTATKSTTDDMASSVEGLFHGPTGGSRELIDCCSASCR